MDIQTFIDNYQETFSGKAELPIASGIPIRYREN